MVLLVWKVSYKLRKTQSFHNSTCNHNNTSYPTRNKTKCNHSSSMYTKKTVAVAANEENLLKQRFYNENNLTEKLLKM